MYFCMLDHLNMFHAIPLLLYLMTLKYVLSNIIQILFLVGNWTITLCYCQIIL